MKLDSYIDAGVAVAVDLVNRLVIRPEPATNAVLTDVLAIDPPSLERLRAADVPGFVCLAERLQHVFADMSADEDGAATQLNELLAEHSAHPHLAKDGDRWRLHHHPADVAVVPMWTAICAEALARLLAGGHAARVSTCADSRCGRVFVDVSRNSSRRFCSTTCQNRIKTATLRRKRNSSSSDQPSPSRLHI